MAASKIKIRLLTSRVDGNESWVVGDIIEVDAAEAKALLEKGLGEAVAETRAKKATKATADKTVETR
jgi:hypothetical protein